MTKDTLTIKLDLTEIKEKLNNYILHKVKEQIKHDLEYDGLEIVNLDFPKIEVRYPEVQERLEKLEDWKLDIEQGWISLEKKKK